MSEYNLDSNIKTYLDSIDNVLQNELSAWPFRYYIIDRIMSETDNDCSDTNIYKFKYIPNPSDSEFNLEELFKQIE